MSLVENIRLDSNQVMYRDITVQEALDRNKFDLATQGISLDSAGLNDLFQRLRGSDTVVTSSTPLTFQIDTDVTLYGSMDLSNCTFNYVGGNVYHRDERESSEYIKSITLTGYPLAERSASITASESLVGWENSLVKITSTEVDLYRLLNGVYSPMYKGEVNYMSRSGELMYTLKNTYNNPVACTLYKLPSTRVRVVTPKFTGAVNRWCINFLRSFTDVECVYDNTLTTVPVDKSIISSSEAFGNTYKLYSSGIPQPDNNSRYFFLSEYILGTTFYKCVVGTGWKSIDGNYCRDTVLQDCNINNLGMHYGCSGVSGYNCNITGGIGIGTGALDERVAFYNSRIPMLGIRNDYGELKGQLIVEGGSIIIPATATGTVRLLDLRQLNITSAGQVQPRPLNLPRVIRINAEIVWSSAVTLDIIAFNNAVLTSAARDFVLPSVISFEGSVFQGQNARFEFAQAYHDASTRTPMQILLTPKVSTCQVQAYLGYFAEYSNSLYWLRANMDMTYNNVTSMSTRSKLEQVGGTVRALRLWSGGTVYASGAVTMQDCVFIWNTNNNISNAGYLRIQNCTFDGGTGTAPVVNTWAHWARGNICYNLVATDSRDVLDKKFLVTTRSGEGGNFTGSELVPYWR